MIDVTSLDPIAAIYQNDETQIVLVEGGVIREGAVAELRKLTGIPIVPAEEPTRFGPTKWRTIAWGRRWEDATDGRDLIQRLFLCSFLSSIRLRGTIELHDPERWVYTDTALERLDRLVWAAADRAYGAGHASLADRAWSLTERLREAQDSEARFRATLDRLAHPNTAEGWYTSKWEGETVRHEAAVRERADLMRIVPELVTQVGVWKGHVADDPLLSNLAAVVDQELTGQTIDASTPATPPLPLEQWLAQEEAQTNLQLVEVQREIERVSAEIEEVHRIAAAVRASIGRVTEVP